MGRKPASMTSTHTQPNRQAADAIPEADLPAPQGIGMAVAFDWGLAVQIIITPFLPLLLGGGNAYLKGLKFGPVINVVVSFLVFLPFAALIAVFGEGVRRGWR